MKFSTAMSVNSLGHIDRLDRVHSFVWERLFLQRTQAFHSSVLPALPDRLSAPASSRLELQEGRWEDFWDFLLHLTGRCKGNCSKSSLLTFRLMFCLPMSVGNVFFFSLEIFSDGKKEYWLLRFSGKIKNLCMENVLFILPQNSEDS